MSSRLSTCLLALIVIAATPQHSLRAQEAENRRPPYRTHNDPLVPREYASPSDWERRASYLRDHIRASAGLLPRPEKTPFRAQIFVERSYIPGLGHAGDFQTAIAMARGMVVVHNTGEKFKVEGARLHKEKLTSPDIAALLRAQR